jgi:hypothetical protein
MFFVTHSQRFNSQQPFRAIFYACFIPPVPSFPEFPRTNLLGCARKNYGTNMLLTSESSNPFWPIFKHGNILSKKKNP